MKILLSMALLLSTFCSHAASLSLIPHANTISTGTNLSVDLVLSGLGDHTAPLLAGFDVDVSFDADKLHLNSIDFTGVLGDVSLSEATNNTDTSSAGVANLFGLSYLEASAANCSFCLAPYLESLQSGTVTLAHLSFTATQVGNAHLNLNINSLADANGELLSATIAAPITVAITAVPVPTALWLFSTGLSGLMLLGRRHRLQN